MHLTISSLVWGCLAFNVFGNIKTTVTSQASTQSKLTSKASTSTAVASSVSGSAAVPSPTGVAVKKHNVWNDISAAEAAQLFQWLHAPAQKLNLTKPENATAWDNTIVTLEALRPNKSDVIKYLDHDGPMPVRYARVVLEYNSNLAPYMSENIIGPLPLSNATTIKPLTYVHNSGRSTTKNVYADFLAQYLWLQGIGAEIADITTDLLNDTFGGNGTLDCYGPDPYYENGRLLEWVQFWSQGLGQSDSGTLLPQGLYLKADITGRDSSKYKLLKVLYNNIVYNSTADFRAAWKKPGFQKLPINQDGPWTSTDRAGAALPLDKNAPPTTFQVSKPRFTLNSTESFVSWMGFTFYHTFNSDTGITLYDIHFNGERIMYELGLQEAVAHYAGNDPVQSGTAYLDSLYGLGSTMFSMVPGYDCPSYATYLNVTYHRQEATSIHENAICMFEHDMAFPIQRHTAENYVSSSKNIAFTMRGISTVGNYDYMFDYVFGLDGSIEVKVRASGYIQSAYPAHNEQYGNRVHSVLSGSMHTHVLNFKADLDINGTSNSIQKTDVVNENIVYPWSDGKARNTMRLNKTFIATENDSILDWPTNGQSILAIVNKDAPNAYGELRGYKIMPGTGIGTPVHLAISDSPILQQAADYAKHDLHITKQKDTEPRSASPANALDPSNPLIKFGSFLDGESLDQEDLVVWFNVGLHHIPHTGDIPNTVFSSSQTSVIFAPYNFLLSDPSRQTNQQVRVTISEDDGKKDIVNTFGSVALAGSVDASSANVDLGDYGTSEVGGFRSPYYFYPSS